MHSFQSPDLWYLTVLHFCALFFTAAGATAVFSVDRQGSGFNNTR